MTWTMWWVAHDREKHPSEDTGFRLSLAKGSLGRNDGEYCRSGTNLATRMDSRIAPMHVKDAHPLHPGYRCDASAFTAA